MAHDGHRCVWCDVRSAYLRVHLSVSVLSGDQSMRLAQQLAGCESEEGQAVVMARDEFSHNRMYRVAKGAGVEGSRRGGYVRVRQEGDKICRCQSQRWCQVLRLVVVGLFFPLGIMESDGKSLSFAKKQKTPKA